MKPIVYLFTGEAAGKTTSALGVALRAIGHKQKVIIIQFMKCSRNIGEYKIKDKLKPYYEIHQFGTKKFVNLKNPTKKDKKLAKKALALTENLIKKAPDLLILDEINLAASIDLIDIKEVLDLIKKIPNKTRVYLTGRNAPKEFIEIADFVVVFKQKKAKKIPPKQGIEF
jgi:cob(I)alamin adenosyltransferase